MCDFHDAAAATGSDEWVLEGNPALEAFITACNDIRRRVDDPRAVTAGIRPHFAQLLADQAWLPDSLMQGADSGMGRGIGMNLLYRAADGGLTFSVLILPPGAQTPVHDHLAWGLVGLYRGGQEEDVFARRDDGATPGRAVLAISEHNLLRPGDFYELLPGNDIHRVRTTSATTSVSLHLLGNDNGCILRHRYDPDSERVEDWRSGWVNRPCRETTPAA